VLDFTTARGGSPNVAPMARDLYRAIHKAMRKDLFEVSALLASTNLEDTGAVEALRARFGGLVASMRHHATSDLADDETVHVDGTNGIVTVVGRPPPE
jgi:hypothetical protein